MDFFHEFYLTSVPSFSGRIQIRHWSDLGICKGKRAFSISPLFFFQIKYIPEDIL